MKSQYLVLAENITYKNNKLSCINIIDHFLTVKLPAEINFDLVAMCGPDWDEGEYSISIKFQIDEGQLNDLGTTNIKVPGHDFVYNAIAPNLKLNIPDGTKFVRFFVYRDEELVIQRSYKIAALFIPQEVKQAEQAENVS